MSHYPELVDTTQVNSTVIANGPAAGRTEIKAGGRPLTFVTNVHADAFFDEIVTLAKNAPLY